MRGVRTFHGRAQGADQMGWTGNASRATDCPSCGHCRRVYFADDEDVNSSDTDDDAHVTFTTLQVTIDANTTNEELYEIYTAVKRRWRAQTGRMPRRFRYRGSSKGKGRGKGRYRRPSGWSFLNDAGGEWGG